MVASASGLTWPSSDKAQRATQQNTICVKVLGAVASFPQLDTHKGHCKELWGHMVAQCPPPALSRSQHIAQGQDSALLPAAEIPGNFLACIKPGSQKPALLG